MQGQRYDTNLGWVETPEDKGLPHLREEQNLHRCTSTIPPGPGDTILVCDCARLQLDIRSCQRQAWVENVGK